MLAITEGTDSLPYASANAKEGQYPRPCEKRDTRDIYRFPRYTIPYPWPQQQADRYRNPRQHIHHHHPILLAYRLGTAVVSHPPSPSPTASSSSQPWILGFGLWFPVCPAMQNATQNLPNPARAPQTFNAPHQRTSSYCHLAIGWVGQYARVVRIRRVLLSGNECEGSTSRLYHYHLGIISSPHNPSQFPPDFPSPPHPPSLFPFSLPRLNAKPRCTTTPYDSQIG